MDAKYYLNHVEEIREISRQGTEVKCDDYPVDVALDIFDQKHGLAHDPLARAMLFDHLGLVMSNDYQTLVREYKEAHKEDK